MLAICVVYDMIKAFTEKSNDRFVFQKHKLGNEAEHALTG
jgi:hypothetical protein